MSTYIKCKEVRYIEAEQIENLFAGNIRQLLMDAKLNYDKLYEIRLRVGRPLFLTYDGGECFLKRPGQEQYLVTREDLKETLEYVTGYSLYAYEDEIRQGYISVQGGHRVGVTGKVILDRGRIMGMKYISCINVRLAHEVQGCADSIMSYKLKPFFRRLVEEFRDSGITLMMSDSIPISEMVRDRQIDIGITNNIVPFAELKKHELFRESYVLVTHEKKERREGEKVHMKMLDPAHEVYHIFSQDFNRWHNYWIHPGNEKARVNLAHVAIDFLTDEKDWTILPESVAQTLIEERRGNDDLHMYALAPDVPERVAIAVTNRNAGQETARLTDEVIRLLKLWLAGEDV